MAIEDPNAQAYEPDLYVDDMVWPPPHWMVDPTADAAAPGVEQASSSESMLPQVGADIVAKPPPPPPPPPKKDEPKKLGEEVPSAGPPIGNPMPVTAAFHPSVVPSLVAPPMADAITGGVTADQAKAPTGAAELEPDAISGGQTPEQLADDTRAQQLGTDVGTASLERNLENMSPEDQTRVELAREAERTNQYHQQALAALKDQQAREQAAADAHAKIQAQLQAQEAQDRAQAQQLANTKIETTPGIGRLIAGAVAGILGGLASPYTGGRNLGVEGFTAGLNRWIDGQKANLANKQGLLGKSMALTSDQIARENEAYRQGEILRAAAYQRAIDRALAEAQNYDPRGTTAQKIADGVGQLKAQQAANWQAFQQQQFGNQLKLEDAKLKEAQFVETARHNRTEEGTAAYSAQTGRLTAQNEANRLAQEQADAAQAKADKARTDVMQNGVMVPTGRVIAGPDGTQMPEMVPALQQDGKPFTMSEQLSEKFQPIKSGTLEAIRAIDKLRELRQQYGGSSQAAKFIGTSEAGRQLEQQAAQAVVALHKASGVTRFSPEVIKLMHNALTGGLDSDSARALMDELDQARKDTIANYNAELKGANYNGKPIDIPDPLAAPAPKLDRVDQAVKDASSLNEIEQHQYGPGVIMAGPAVGLEGQLAGASTRGAAIDQLVNVYQTSQDDAERQRAVIGLQQIAQSAPDEGTRAYAAQKLATIRTAGPGGGVLLHSGGGL